MNDVNKNKNYPNPAIIEKFLSVQEQELVMRGKELEIQQQSNNNSHEYATAALQASKEDREASRKHDQVVVKTQYIFYGIVFFGLLLLGVIALYLNKDQIVMEALKAILLFGSGGIGGYAFAKTKKEPEQS